MDIFSRTLPHVIDRHLFSLYLALVHREKSKDQLLPSAVQIRLGPHLDFALSAHLQRLIYRTYQYITGQLHILNVMLFQLPHNFLIIDPFLTRPVPIESSHSQLSIGTGLVKNGHKLRTLWNNRKKHYIHYV